MRCRPFHGFGGLPAICRHNDRDVVERAQPGEVFNGVVGRSKLAVGHAGGLPDKLHVEVGVGDIGLHLLQRAAGQKAGCGGNKGDATAVCQTCADADHVLLGNADIDQAIGMLLLEAAEFR